jgi:predicted ArsR family transcriptional regulator
MPADAASLDLPLERDLFLRQLLRELAGTLEDVVGHDEAAGFIGIVGQNIGRWIDDAYCQAWGQERLDREQVAAVLVDLKRRIQGDFYLISVTPDEIVLGNRRCPFGDKVRDRTSLCMMTSNVFGTLAAENLGYGRVILHETIAAGAPGCRVSVRLKRDPDTSEGIEYFGD